MEGGVVGHPLQQPVAHDLHLSQRTGAGMELQRGVARGQGQRHRRVAVGELLLQLGQQRCRRHSTGMAARGGEEQLLGALLAQLGIAGALQQLLEFRPETPEAGLQGRGRQQPVKVEGILQRFLQLAAAVLAALPQVGAGGQQVQLHPPMAGEGLQQAHLYRRQAAQAEQAQRLLGRRTRRMAWTVQPFDRPFHAQSARFHPQALAQGCVEGGLPGQRLGEGFGGSAPGFAPLPGPQQVGAIEGVVVEGIGDSPAQLPGGQIEAPSLAAPLQPAPQWRARLAGGEGGKELQQGPHQAAGPPRIGGRLLGRLAGVGRHGLGEQLLHQQAQAGGREGKAQVGGHSAELLSQPFP